MRLGLRLTLRQNGSKPAASQTEDQPAASQGEHPPAAEQADDQSTGTSAGDQTAVSQPDSDPAGTPFSGAAADESSPWPQDPPAASWPEDPPASGPDDPPASAGPEDLTLAPGRRSRLPTPGPRADRPFPPTGGRARRLPRGVRPGRFPGRGRRASAVRCVRRRVRHRRGALGHPDRGLQRACPAMGPDRAGPPGGRPLDARRRHAVAAHHRPARDQPPVAARPRGPRGRRPGRADARAGHRDAGDPPGVLAGARARAVARPCLPARAHGADRPAVGGGPGHPRRAGTSRPLARALHAAAAPGTGTQAQGRPASRAAPGPPGGGSRARWWSRQASRSGS